MINANVLRDRSILKMIDENPGYYKWWCKKEELDTILKELDVSFDSIKSYLEIENDLFCIYVGIAVKESVRSRLNWHVNDKHGRSQVIHGTLSTLRQSISSIAAHNQFDKQATDLFIDKLYVEWFYSQNAIGSDSAKTELESIEKQMMSEYLRPLNIQNNNHPLAEQLKRKLKQLRKSSKHNTDF